jgi:hypothetical protein
MSELTHLTALILRMTIFPARDGAKCGIINYEEMG